MKDELKTIYVFDGNKDDGDWPPESLKEFLYWFAAKFDEIPDEHRHRARVVLSGGYANHSGHHASIEIYYHRPESEDEIKIRERNQGIIDRQKKERDFETLQKLITKHYGPKARVIDKEE